MSWGRRTISVDDATWQMARDFVKDQTGMTMSKFIEIYLRGIVRAAKRNSSVRDIVADSLDDFIEVDESLTAREKLRMGDLFDKKIRGSKKGVRRK